MSQQPQGTLPRTSLSPSRQCEEASIWELGCALHERLRQQSKHDSYAIAQQHLRLFTSLRDALEPLVDVRDNRLSPRHFDWQFSFTHMSMVKHGLPMRGAVHLDIGCGSQNPLGRMFAHLMAGAARGLCLELDTIQDWPEAVRCLARMVSAAVVQPKWVFDALPIDNRTCLENVADFDLPALAAGDHSKIDPKRLSFLARSAADTGLDDASVDVVVSNSVLEHVGDPRAVLTELARITKPGGFAMHGIDVADHRWYGTPSLHKLDFLTIASEEPIVHWCNRLRLPDFERLFPQYGFDVLERLYGPPVSIPAEFRTRLQEPWASMPDEQLGLTWSQYLLRRR